MDSQATESIKTVMTEKEAKAKVKGVMKRNGRAMKTVMDTVVQQLMTPEFGYIGEGEEQGTTQAMKDALENLIRAMRKQSNRQAMYAVKDHPKTTAKAWIKSGQHMYPLADLADIPLASNLAYTQFCGKVTPQVAMECLSLQDSDIRVKVETIEEPMDYTQEPADLNMSKRQLILDESGKEIVQYLDTLSQDVWTVALSGSSSEDNNTSMPDSTLPQTESLQTMDTDMITLDSSPPQSFQQGDVLSSPPLTTQSMNEEPEDNEGMGDYYARHTKPLLQRYTYSAMAASMHHPTIKRHEFINMPATYWIIWNMYWMSMDMANSTEAKEACTSLRHMLTAFPTLSKKGAESMLAPFAHVKALKLQYDIGKQLLDSKHRFGSVLKEQIGELYNGTWLASKE
ncbi:hypothetical protein L210DRAFT_3512237 [Boletus edulis BED1]|uniref:Uncharacterized protein n=1 Tax=Boletus edulis BED1 TaxID=1328754 RepID=A0AAD4BAF2_BOLED|nr:hypothetical protein L210DRAFT_3512237 [Boletus edulis BED1]